VQTAWMMSAPRTASGSRREQRSEKSRVTKVATQVTRLLTCVRAPAPSFTADADMLPPTIMPPKSASEVGEGVRVQFLIGVHLVPVLHGELVRSPERLAEDTRQYTDLPAAPCRGSPPGAPAGSSPTAVRRAACDDLDPYFPARSSAELKPIAPKRTTSLPVSSCSGAAARRGSASETAPAAKVAQLASAVLAGSGGASRIVLPSGLGTPNSL